MSRKENSAETDMLWQQIALSAVLMAALSKIANGAGPSARTAREALAYAKRLAEDDVYAEEHEPEPVAKPQQRAAPAGKPLDAASPATPSEKPVVNDKGDALDARIEKPASTGDAPAGKPAASPKPSPRPQA